MDHRSLYVQVSILNKQVEAVRDSGASVSCLSEKLFKQINENHQIKIQPSTTRLSSANQMPIQIKGTVSVPIKIGSKRYEHTFYVLIEAASDCLLGLDFPETLQKLTEPIVAHYTSLNPATEAALDKFVPAETSYLIAGGSIVLSLFLFKLNFPLFHRQARALCCAPRRFFKNKSGQFIHVTNDIEPNSDSSFLILTRHEFTALRALAKEALLKTAANTPFSYSAEDDEKLYPDVTASTRTIHTTPPLVLLVLTTFTPAPVPHVETTQTTSA